MKMDRKRSISTLEVGNINQRAGHRPSKVSISSKQSQQDLKQKMPLLQTQVAKHDIKKDWLKGMDPAQYSVFLLNSFYLMEIHRCIENMFEEELVNYRRLEQLQNEQVTVTRDVPLKPAKQLTKAERELYIYGGQKIDVEVQKPSKLRSSIRDAYIENKEIKSLRKGEDNILLKDLIPERVEVHLEVQKNLLQSEIVKKKDEKEKSPLRLGEMVSSQEEMSSPYYKDAYMYKTKNDQKQKDQSEPWLSKKYSFRLNLKMRTEAIIIYFQSLKQLTIINNYVKIQSRLNQANPKEKSTKFLLDRVVRFYNLRFVFMFSENYLKQQEKQVKLNNTLTESAYNFSQYLDSQPSFQDNSISSSNPSSDMKKTIPHDNPPNLDFIRPAEKVELVAQPPQNQRKITGHFGGGEEQETKIANPRISITIATPLYNKYNPENDGVIDEEPRSRNSNNIRSSQKFQSGGSSISELKLQTQELQQSEDSMISLLNKTPSVAQSKSSSDNSQTRQQEINMMNPVRRNSPAPIPPQKKAMTEDEAQNIIKKRLSKIASIKRESQSANKDGRLNFKGENTSSYGELSTRKFEDQNYLDDGELMLSDMKEIRPLDSEIQTRSSYFKNDLKNQHPTIDIVPKVNQRPNMSVEQKEKSKPLEINQFRGSEARQQSKFQYSQIDIAKTNQMNLATKMNKPEERKIDHSPAFHQHSPSFDNIDGPYSNAQTPGAFKISFGQEPSVKNIDHKQSIQIDSSNISIKQSETSILQSLIVPAYKRDDYKLIQSQFAQAMQSSSMISASVKSSESPTKTPPPSWLIQPHAHEEQTDIGAIQFYEKPPDFQILRGGPTIPPEKSDKPIVVPSLVETKNYIYRPPEKSPFRTPTVSSVETSKVVQKVTIQDDDFEVEVVNEDEMETTRRIQGIIRRSEASSNRSQLHQIPTTQSDEYKHEPVPSFLIEKPDRLVESRTLFEEPQRDSKPLITPALQEFTYSFEEVANDKNMPSNRHIPSNQHESPPLLEENYHRYVDLNNLNINRSNLLVKKVSLLKFEEMSKQQPKNNLPKPPIPVPQVQNFQGILLRYIQSGHRIQHTSGMLLFDFKIEEPKEGPKRTSKTPTKVGVVNKGYNPNEPSSLVRDIYQDYHMKMPEKVQPCLYTEFDLVLSPLELIPRRRSIRNSQAPFITIISQQKLNDHSLFQVTAQIQKILTVLSQHKEHRINDFETASVLQVFTQMLDDLKNDVRFSFDGMVNDIHIYQYKPKLYQDVPNRPHKKSLSNNFEKKGSNSYIVYESYEEQQQKNF